MPICTIDGCNRPNMARGLCRAHYCRAMRAKELPPKPVWPTVYERLDRHHVRGKVDECWLWAGAKDKQGYGHIGNGKKVFLAHRMMWERENGHKVPDSMVVMHICDTPSCVNPAHLRAGTFQENIQDCIDKGRKASTAGELHPGRTLTEEDVRHIRSSCLNASELAGLYKVSRDTIHNVRSRKIWKHVL